MDQRISELPVTTVLQSNAIIPIIQTDPSDGLVKNFGLPAAQLMGSATSATPAPAPAQTGWVLLGSLKGADMNAIPTLIIGYEDFAGKYPFAAGDTIIDANGTAALIESAAAGKLTVSGINIGSAVAVGDKITSSTAYIIYGGESSPFAAGTELVGSKSGAKAIVISDDGKSQLMINNVTGIFIPGELALNPDNTVKATVAYYVPPATAVVTGYQYLPDDQPVTLSGGSSYILTDMVVTNASIPLTNAAGGLLYNGTGRTGATFFEVDGLALLTDPTAYIEADNTIKPLLPGVTTGSPVYFSLATAQGQDATADIYIYGYILA
jgi:hypothetical protein